MDPPERARNGYKKRGCSLGSDSHYTSVRSSEHGIMGNINMIRRQYIKQQISTIISNKNDLGIPSQKKNKN